MAVWQQLTGGWFAHSPVRRLPQARLRLWQSRWPLLWPHVLQGPWKLNQDAGTSHKFIQVHQFTYVLRQKPLNPQQICAGAGPAKHRTWLEALHAQCCELSLGDRWAPSMFLLKLASATSNLETFHADKPDQTQWSCGSCGQAAPR